MCCSWDDDYYYYYSKFLTFFDPSPRWGRSNQLNLVPEFMSEWEALGKWMVQSGDDFLQELWTGCFGKSLSASLRAWWEILCFSKSNPLYLLSVIVPGQRGGSGSLFCKSFLQTSELKRERGGRRSSVKKPRGNLQTQTSPWSLTFSKFISRCKILLFTQAKRDNLKLSRCSAFSLPKGNVIPPAGGKSKCNTQIQENPS